VRTFAAAVLARAGLALVGLALALGLVEGALRVAGALVTARREAQDRRDLGRAEAVVLCLGESTTEGRRETSWPRALQEQLDARLGTGRAKVVNLGLSGTNSRDILARLPDDLAAWKPAVVVTLMGINDGCLEPGQGAWSPVPPPPAWRPPDTSWRVVKLAWWLRRALTSPATGEGSSAFGGDLVAPSHRRGGSGVVEHDPPTPGLQQAIDLAKRDQVADAETAFAAVVAEEPRYLDAWLRWAALLDRRGRAPQAVALLERALPVLPGSTWLRRDLALLYARADRHADAARLLEQALPLDPDDDVPRALLAAELRALGREAEAARVEADVVALRADHPHPATARNYRRLAGRVLGAGAALVAVQYPLRDPELLRRALEGWVPPVHVVDLRVPFQRAVAERGYDALFTDRFGGDFGHTTAEGDRLIAAEVLGPVLDALGAR